MMTMEGRASLAAAHRVVDAEVTAGVAGRDLQVEAPAHDEEFLAGAVGMGADFEAGGCPLGFLGILRACHRRKSRRQQ